MKVPETKACWTSLVCRGLLARCSASSSTTTAACQRRAEAGGGQQGGRGHVDDVQMEQKW